jgi:hypothetical protein
LSSISSERENDFQQWENFMVGSTVRRLAQVTLIVSNLSLAGTAYAADTIKGQVLVGRAPVAKSEVTVWEASPPAPKVVDYDGVSLCNVGNGSLRIGWL